MKKTDLRSNLYHTYYNLLRRQDVTVCQSWRNNFKTFEKWCMEHGYTEGARIIRIDKRKPFQPSNTKIVCLSYAKKMRSLANKCKGHPISKIRIKMNPPNARRN